MLSEMLSKQNSEPSMPDLHIYFICFTIAIALFSMLLSACKQPNQLSDKLFTVFLASIVLPMLFRAIPGTQGLLKIIAPVLNYLPLTLGPLMYLYTSSLVHENFRINKKVALHFLPLVILAIIGTFFTNNSGMAGIAPVDQEINTFSIIAPLTLIISFLVYSIHTQRLLKTHRKKVLDCFTHTSSRVTLTWLTWLVFVFFNLFILTHIPIFFRALNPTPVDTSIVVWAEVIHNTGIFLFVLSLSFFGVQQPVVFPNLKQIDHNESTEKDISLGKYETSSLKEQQLEEYLRRIESYMLAKKPYLDGDLTLAGLAELLDMPRHHLTETINSKLGKNFFTYVNGYRILEAKLLLINPQSRDLTILEISHLAGFNSKSSFNTFFKKCTQMSPTQFREKHDS
jgi:AraC-like DNA-binding protein